MSGSIGDMKIPVGLERVFEPVLEVSLLVANLFARAPPRNRRV
jgi:hypothetical protein